MVRLSFLVTLIFAAMSPLGWADTPPRCDGLLSPTKKTSAELPERVRTMDKGRLDAAWVDRAKPSTAAQLKDLVQYAKRNGLNVSLRGTNHSQGGQNYLKDAHGKVKTLQIDMRGLNKIISFSPDQKTLTVESGITWGEITQFLNAKGYSIIVQQSSNIFSAGGSLSTNVHGRDISGPLIHTVRSFKLLMADRQEVTASPHENPDLFRATIGGYGAFGIITQITFNIAPNQVFRADNERGLSIDEYVDYLRKHVRDAKSPLFHYARLNVGGRTPLSRVNFITWQPVAPAEVPPKTWSGWKLDTQEHNRFISATIMNLMRWTPTSNTGKRVKDFLDSRFGAAKTGTLKTRNNIMDPPVHFLFDLMFNEKKTVDILQEYFVPPERLAKFLTRLRGTVKKYDLDLMNVTLRYVPKVEAARDSLLNPYSRHWDRVAVVLYFNVDEVPDSDDKTERIVYNGKQWTQELTDSAIAVGGSFYLPYQSWWTSYEIRSAYPNLREFFNLKKKWDPQGLFQSKFLKILQRASGQNSP